MLDVWGLMAGAGGGSDTAAPQQVAEVVAAAEAAVVRARDARDRRAEAAGLAVLGWCHLLAGDAAAAQWALQRAIASCGDGCDTAVAGLAGSGLALQAFGPGRVLSGGETLAFRSRNSVRLLFLLMLAGPDGLSLEQITDRMWPDDPGVSGRRSGRLRTLMWDVRRGLRAEAWRLVRDGAGLRLVASGVPFDLAAVRARARSALEAGDRAAAVGLAADLRRPLLTRWAYDEWVLAEDTVNEALAHRLDALASGR